MKKLNVKRTIMTLGLCLLPVTLLAEDASTMSGLDIMQMVDQREDGEHVTRRFKIQLTDKSGVTREQDTIGYRKYIGDVKKNILFYTEPTNVRGTGFLTFDYDETSKDDDRWLYLPALRKVRRIAASDRGAYFLGTDFTYEDISNEQKVTLSDYQFNATGKVSVDGVEVIVVEGIPMDESVSKELGYSRVVWHVDPKGWMSLLTRFYDINGTHLKTAKLEEIQEIDGILTATKIHIENHKTLHQTRLIFREVDYKTPIANSLFKQNRLKRGL